MLPDYPLTAAHCPRQLHPTPRHSRGLGARILNTSIAPHDFNPTCCQRRREAGQPRSHGRVQQPAKTCWHVLGVPVCGHGRRSHSGGGRACRLSAKRAASERARGLCSHQASERAQSGPHHPTRPERLADPESRATRGSSRVIVSDCARRLHSDRSRPSRIALLLRKGYMDVCTMQHRRYVCSTGGMHMRMRRRQVAGGRW